MKLRNVGYRQASRCGWSDGRYAIPVDETAEVPDAVGERLLAQFTGAFVVVEDAAAPAQETAAAVPEAPRAHRRRRAG